MEERQCWSSLLMSWGCSSSYTPNPPPPYLLPYLFPTSQNSPSLSVLPVLPFVPGKFRRSSTHFNGAKLTQKLASRIRISHESLNEKISSPYSPRPRWYLHSINKLEHMRVYKSGFCVCLKFHSPPTYISNSNQQNLDLTSKLLEASTPEENSTGSNCFLETKILLCT